MVYTSVRQTNKFMEIKYFLEVLRAVNITAIALRKITQRSLTDKQRSFR